MVALEVSTALVYFFLLWNGSMESSNKSGYLAGPRLAVYEVDGVSNWQ